MSNRRKPTLKDLRDMIEEVDEDRSKAFEERFILHKPSLAQQAESDLAGAVRRERQALRCFLLLDGFASGYLVYPDHWLRVLEVVQEKLREAVTLLQRVNLLLADKPTTVREEVIGSEKVRDFVSAMWEFVRVGRLVLASACDALAELVSAEQDHFEQLVEEYTSCLQVFTGMDMVCPVPSMEEIRWATTDEPPGDVLDSKSICNVCLIPVSAAKLVGAQVLFFSGAPYFAPCLNLYLTNIGGDAPQPESEDLLDW